MDFQLRDFQEADFETLWSIDQRCFAPGIAYSQRELSIYIRQRGAFTLVAEAMSPGDATTSPVIGFLVGFVVAEARRGTGHIITIDVLPTARRSGVGSKLLNACEERLRRGQCNNVYLETAVDNQAALVFYKQHGYFLERVVPRYYANGVDALILRKNLLQKDLLSTAQAS